jgi:hypothetical protein
MSLALLVVAVIDHGHLQVDFSGAVPHTSGLLRLGRDLMRRADGEVTEPAGSDSVSSQNQGSRMAAG